MKETHFTLDSSISIAIYREVAAVYGHIDHCLDTCRDAKAFFDEFPREYSKPVPCFSPLLILWPRKHAIGLKSVWRAT